ncbi:MAG: group III truncated hemoglobin [Bacteroidia bacterium]|nr:group III truncated hemoglobin [Bacteroidia bacterium]
MKQDIQTGEDIRQLVDTFYKKAISDPVIGHFFTQVVQLDFDLHMPVMYSFWESVLLGQAGYKGNPMLKHLELNKKSPLEKYHFDRWMSLWEETLDELFSGKTADQARQRAANLRHLMEYKIGQSQNPNFIQ